jgi:hypothetical protein
VRRRRESNRVGGGRRRQRQVGAERRLLRLEPDRLHECGVVSERVGKQPGELEA